MLDTLSCTSRARWVPLSLPSPTHKKKQKKNLDNYLIVRFAASPNPFIKLCRLSASKHQALVLITGRLFCFVVTGCKVKHQISALSGHSTATALKHWGFYLGDSPRVVMYGCSQSITGTTRKNTKWGPDGLLPVWSLQQTIYHLTNTRNTDLIGGTKIFFFVTHFSPLPPEDCLEGSDLFRSKLSRFLLSRLLIFLSNICWFKWF